MKDKTYDDAARTEKAAVSKIDDEISARAVIGFLLLFPLVIAWATVFSTVWPPAENGLETPTQGVADLASFVVAITLLYRFTPFLDIIERAYHQGISRLARLPTDAAVRISRAAAFVPLILAFAATWWTYIGPVASALEQARQAAGHIHNAIIGVRTEANPPALIVGVRASAVSQLPAQRGGLTDPAAILRYELPWNGVQSLSDSIQADTAAFLAGQRPRSAVQIGNQEALQTSKYRDTISEFAFVSTVGVFGVHPLSPLAQGMTLFAALVFALTVTWTKNIQRRLVRAIIGAPFVALLALLPLLWVHLVEA